jgi:hypothetical protein
MPAACRLAGPAWTLFGRIMLRACTTPAGSRNCTPVHAARLDAKDSSVPTWVHLWQDIVCTPGCHQGLGLTPPERLSQHHVMASAQLRQLHPHSALLPTFSSIGGNCTVRYDTLHCSLAGASTGNTQSPIDARYKFAPSNPDAKVAVADSAPLAHGDQPVIPQVCTELEAQTFEPHGMHTLACAPI